MAEKEKAFICPLFVIGWDHRSLNEITCMREKCMWFHKGECAVARIPDELSMLEAALEQKE